MHLAAASNLRLAGRLAAAAWAVLLSPLVAGCDGAIHNPDSQHFAGAISPRAAWTASGEVRDAYYAIDERIETAATAPAGYSRASLTVDLGRASFIGMVVVDHGADEHAYSRSMAVLTSDDGTGWAHRITVPGTRRLTYALLPKRVLARYVRVEAVEPGAGKWSIAEIYLK